MKCTTIFSIDRYASLAMFRNVLEASSNRSVRRTCRTRRALTFVSPFQLLRKIPNERLGSGAEDVADIKRQPFFDQIDWEKLEARKITPPWKPSVSGPTDLTQVDKVFTQEIVSPSVQEHFLGSVTNRDPLFVGFTFVHEGHMNN